MNRLALLATVASLTLTGAAFAQTNSTSSTTPPTPAAAATAPTQTPSTSAQTAPLAPAAPAPEKSMAAQPEDKTATEPAKSAETAKPAEPKAAMERKAEPRPMRAVHHERMRHHTAMHATMAASRLADRETKALNVLQANGYGSDYQNFQRDGNNYSATVTKNGKPEKVTIDPDTGTVTPQR